MTSTSAPAPTRRVNSARVGVQKFGTFLSSMVMPNIPAFIAWGLITAFFIQTGWTPNGVLGGFGTTGGVANVGLVGPMITYLLPLLIANSGGRLVYGARGGVVAAIATVGVIIGGNVPMFLGAMIVGPLAALIMKHLDKLWDGKIKPGFEMLVNNFSAGILGALLAIGGFFGVAPLIDGASSFLESVVNELIKLHLLPIVSLFVEPGKVLFLNNAINHGVFTPLGTIEAKQTGSSILFLIETNPGPGLGVLLAYTIFGTGIARASAPGAIIIEFLGGIHEIYFPYVLMKPILIVATILGGATGVAINAAFHDGLRAPASPGSVFAIFAEAPLDNMFGIGCAILGATIVSGGLSSIFLLRSRKRDLETGGGDLAAAVAATVANKGKESSVLGGLVKGGSPADASGVDAPHETPSDRPLEPVHSIVFACDAGMGSSAMGASVLRNKLKKAGIADVTVRNRAIADLKDGEADVIVTHQDLTDRARQKSPSSVHVSVENFMNSTKYDEVVETVRESNESRLASSGASND